MATKFEMRMYRFAKKHNLALEWQDMKFGYRRASIPCESDLEFHTVQGLVQKMKNVKVEIWACYEGQFEGYVYAMDEAEWLEMSQKQEEEMGRLEDWWQRYHNADGEARRLMACGAIS